MKIERKNLRVAEWFDADDHSIAYVVETLREGKWTGVLLSGQPLAFATCDDAEAALNFLVGVNVPEAKMTDCSPCVAKQEGG
jgi:hypothetical protein